MHSNKSSRENTSRCLLRQTILKVVEEEEKEKEETTCSKRDATLPAQKYPPSQRVKACRDFF
jgi:hypothetical protein